MVTPNIHHTGLSTGVWNYWNAPHELRRPEADYLRDDIYELRVGLQGMNYRMLYFFHGRVAAVLVHSLVKEREVPPRDIEEAIRRKRKFELDLSGILKSDHRRRGDSPPPVLPR